MGKWLDLLVSQEAVYLDRHFVYASGKHGSGYINIDPILPLGDEMFEIGQELAISFLHGHTSGFDVVAAPAVGGIRLADVVQFACHNMGYGVDCVFAEKDPEDGEFRLERQGFRARVKGQRVLVVDDIVNTGGSAVKTARAIEVAGGEVIAIACVVSRGLATAEGMQVPHFVALETVEFDAYAPDACPLCAEKVPVVIDIGHGAEFAFKNPAYPSCDLVTSTAQEAVRTITGQ